MTHFMRFFSRAQLTYTIMLGLSLVLALLLVGSGGSRVALGVLVVTLALLSLLALSSRFGQTKYFWSSVEFLTLLSGLFSVLSGLAAFTQSQHVKAQAQLADEVKEAYVTLLNIGERVYFECSGRLPVAGNNPPNDCERTGHFLRQIRDERDRPSSVETGLGNRWDLNLCRTPVPDRVEATDWKYLCQAAEQLSMRQEKVRAHIAKKPAGLFVTALTGPPLLFVLLSTAILFGARCAKFLYDIRKHAHVDDGKNPA